MPPFISVPPQTCNTHACIYAFFEHVYRYLPAYLNGNARKFLIRLLLLFIVFSNLSSEVESKMTRTTAF